MLKAVIVDDEPSVLEGLKIFVDWQKEGYEIVGEASDGLSAFPIICEKHPDLVICDIRMPGLNGLELLEKIRKTVSPVPKFLMLSGYSEFSYARKAMQLGAVGYLTKPLDSEELSSELSRVAEIIENERRINEENLEFIRYTANQLYNEITSGKRGEKLKRKAHFIFDIPQRAKVRMIRFITIPNIHPAPDSKIYDFFLNIAGVKNENCIFYNGNGNYILVMHDGMDFFPDYTELAGRIKEIFSHPNPWVFGLHSFSALISGVSYDEMPESIDICSRQIEQLYTYYLLQPENNVLCYEELHKKPVFSERIAKMESVIPERLFDKVINAVKGNDYQQVVGAVENFFDELGKNADSTLSNTICLYRLAGMIGKTASACGVEAGSILLDFIDAIGNGNGKCKELALSLCTYVFEQINRNAGKSLVLLENEIIDFIKANCCTKNISIQSISEKFSISPMIVSRIIKKKTGRKFNDYINFLRIEHAKTLFAGTDMKITAVCEEVGYSDYGYFIRKFKELTGVLPSDYKKKYS
ncbi:response regulator [Thermoclostridium stercorarium subsp. stercorarium DSM 8532]|uniref:Stage 0 sporulation protein A homolog n=2 Tax=Thermoclostridium stercorarium TaxID=1510 RepID=L7VQ39_THES1|nr:response regulator [Thermoclostridium stercorarium]AGC67673.1 response regulator [Thermoclostridium stercorarium subsp. stercorarium DSM 8532]AGI38720.1 transcriptional regulator [Thermoclostridium stercorarium subsp. stercorarium DSM 8532]ANW98090.1 two-component system response regulator [Thermoclostridium stercorarium subsp. thermolacticum DSM 2910]UZQ86244.1 response regulator [Thermoclostridium stercorarium]